jgi:hypothetical protein
MQLARAGGLRDPKGPYVRAMACWVVCAIAGLMNVGVQSERWSWRS